MARVKRRTACRLEDFKVQLFPKGGYIPSRKPNQKQEEISLNVILLTQYGGRILGPIAKVLG